MAVQTFPVVIGVVKVNGIHWRPEPIDVDVMQAIQLGFDGPEHGVIGVTCVAGLVSGDTVILEVGGWNVGGIVHVQSSPVGFHNVAGEAELSFFRALHVLRCTHT